jgi:hypothetical protein
VASVREFSIVNIAEICKVNGQRRGSGFAVSRNLVLTAFHCIGNRHTGEIKRARVLVRFGTEQPIAADVIGGDRLADFALLSLVDPLPPQVRPLRVTVDSFHQEPFHCEGHVTGIAGLETATIDGHVMDPWAKLQGSRALQLHCNQSAAQFPLRGFSGAAVLVGPPESPLAIGIVRWNPTSAANPTVGLGGLLYACPIRLVLERRPDLSQYVNYRPPQNEAFSLTVPAVESHPDGLRRFFYGARRGDLQGRKADIEKLDAFLADDRAFLWWAITGPAGLGKSRLAFDFCLRHPIGGLHEDGGWRAGFLRDYDAANFLTWRPNRHTLIVADHVTGRSQELGQIARRLYRRRAEVPFRVRLLLLERDAKAAWLEEFEGSGADYSDTIDARYRPPYTLAPLSDTELWEIIRSWATVPAKLPDRASALEKLRDIDPQRRPLFAALFADALVADDASETPDLQGLLRDVLKREQDVYWTPGDVTPADRELLALATLSGGINYHQPLPAALQDKLRLLSPQRYRFMSGKQVDGRLVPLEPDIIGELFLLDHVRDFQHLDLNAQQMRSLAWAISPIGTGGFLERAVQDFPDHPSLSILQLAPDGDAETRRVWAITAANMLAFFGLRARRSRMEKTTNEDPLNHAHALYDELANLARAHPGEAVLRGEQARAVANLISIDAESAGINELNRRNDELVRLTKDPWLLAQGTANLISAHARARDLRRAKALYRKLERQVRRYRGGDLSSLKYTQARSVLMLVAGYALRNDPGEAGSFYDQLRRLAADHPRESRFRDAQAEAGSFLIECYASLRDHAQVRVLYDELSGLVRDHGDEPSLRFEQVHTAARLVKLLAGADPKRAREWYEELARTVERYGDDRSLAKWQGYALLDMARRAATQSKFEEAQATFDRFAALVDGREDDPELREQLASAAETLSNGYAEAGLLEEARVFYQEVVRRAQRFPDEPALRQQQRFAARELARAYAEADQRSEARAVLEDLAALTSANSGDTFPQEEVASAACHLIYSHLRAGEFQEAQTLYYRIARLAASHPSPWLQRRRIEAAVALMLGHEGEGHFEEAKLVWNEMTDMVQADQDNWFIRHEQAKAASAAMRDQCDLETRPRAQYWYDELTNAARRAPDDPYMRRIQGEAAANLLLAYGSAGQFDEAETLYDEIAGMVFAHADEKELLSPQAASALNLIASYVSADRYDKAQTHYDAMAELSKSHPDESELRADQAKAALNLVIAFCGPDQLEAARRWYDELADVVSAAGREDREELCELQAYGAGMLLAENGRAGRWTEARRLYRTLRRLSRVSSQSTVQEFKAQAAAFLTTHKQTVWADRLVDWTWSVWRRTPWGARAARIPSRFGRTGGRRPRHLRRTSDTETISADPN